MKKEGLLQKNQKGKTMKNKTIKILTIMGLFLGLIEAQEMGQGIKVEVKADQPVETAQNVIEQKDGFNRLEITLSNKGKVPLKIDKITVTIPFAEKLTNDLKMLYGGSCMGRTPAQIRSVADQSNKNSSHMYEMVRLSEDQYLFAGSLSWRIFLPNFMIKEGALVVWSDGEQKQIEPGERISYETIVLKKTKDWVDLLNQFGMAIASENNISKLKPVDFKGWATWDYYGRIFLAEDVYGNIEALKSLTTNTNLIQIDGGWWTQRGDYMSVRPNLPGGIKAIVDRIHAEGKMAGLHFDGFRGDKNAEICKTHPEYFLHDQDGKLIVEVNEKVDQVMYYTFFDYSHPGAREHIAKCIQAMKGWGIQYFKVDFMRYGLENDIKRSNPSVKSIKAYNPAITGVERFRLGMKAIRDAIGEENYFLGCSAVFGPCIGFVDGMRTGGDIHPEYEAFPERSLANSGNFYLKKVFNVDSDYIVLREAADEAANVIKEKKKSGGKLSVNEGKMWADFCTLFGNCRLNSDNLMTLRSERQQVFKEVLEIPAMEEMVPLDLWQHGKDKNDGIELLLARTGKEIYLGVFNWSDKPKEYSVSAFGKAAPVALEGRHSVILKYEGNESFESLVKKLKS